MFKTALRRWLSIISLVTISLTVPWVVRAASSSDPAATPSSPASSAAAPAAPTPPATAPNDPIPDYATHIPITGPTTAFHESVAARYNYAFGKDNPFLPSNATSANGQFVSPKSFYTAEYCGHCHQEAYHQWRQTAHSNSFRAPWYLKNVNLLIDEKGVQYSRHCEGCHNPVALLSGDLSQGMPKKRSFEQEGVTCSTCHS
ncbi:MAG: multiheme c-type cytochrome, partial [Terracidiphilus sp.]